MKDAQSQNLNGKWELRWSDGARGEQLLRVQNGEADWSRAWEANVPGCVHNALIHHGLIPDSAEGANILASRWVEDMFWYYRRTFTVPALPKGIRAWLVFETLDLAAQILFNGKIVGSHANAFRPCRIEVTGMLRVGSNEVVVEIESGLHHAAGLSAEAYTSHRNYRLTKMPWLRKSQSQHGWDWAPRLLNVGISGNVRLDFARRVSVESWSLRASATEDFKQGRLSARIAVENLSRRTVKAEIRLRVSGPGKSSAEKECTIPLSPGHNDVETGLDVSSPQLWWPVGHGVQARYKVTIQVRVAGAVVFEDTKKTAFRHVRFNQEPHPAGGHSFCLEINGKPIFCKGANYVPVDLLLSRVNRARHAALIDLALEANANFLRVWGGGVYESDDFYDLCDERGILVWQDMVFACHRYPATDPAFLADVTAEIRHQVRRLAHHPSLVAWCGNNEMEWGAVSWSSFRGQGHPDYALFHFVIPRLLKVEDPERYYQPSSPFSPDHGSPNDDLSGDQHPWSVGFEQNDFRKYREMQCRFPNEGGILGPPGLAALRAVFSGGPEIPGNFAWELHENAVTCWGSIPPYTHDRMLEDWLGRSLRDMTLEEIVYFGGALQGAGLAEYIKNFRRRMFDSASAIFWMFNDIWPCTRSWTIVDSKANRTPAFWPVRRAFAPVTVVVSREENTVRVHGINEGPALSCSLRYGIFSLRGEYPCDKTARVTLPANASVVLAEFPARDWDRLGVTSHTAFAVLSGDATESDGRREIARDCLILPLLREMEWPVAKVAVRRRGDRVAFTSDSFVWRVCLDLMGMAPLPDNFFDIYPGIPTLLPWPVSKPLPKVLHTGNL